MKFILEKEITKYRILIDAVALAILLATLQALKIVDICGYFFPAKLQAEYQPFIEVLPISALFFLLGRLCIASCKDPEAPPTNIADGKVQEDTEQIKRDTLITWFNARCSAIGNICFAISFLNLLRAFDHNQQSTVCVIALAVIGAIIQDQAKDFYASEKAKRSSNPTERFPVGQYRILPLLTPGKIGICRIVSVEPTVLVVRPVYKDDSEGPELHLPITPTTKGGRSPGTLKELRKALEEGVV